MRGTSIRSSEWSGQVRYGTMMILLYNALAMRLPSGSFSNRAVFRLLMWQIVYCFVEWIEREANIRREDGINRHKV